MSDSFDLETPDYFTAGTVGPPGERVFYLQGRESGTLVTLKVEKEQVRALADYLSGLLARLPGERGGRPSDVELLEPVQAAWVVASLGVGYDASDDRIVIVANELREGDEEAEDEDAGPEPEAETVVEAPEEEAAEVAKAEGDEPAVARFRLTRAQAATFVERARALMRAGRPLCPLCNGPIDAGGHVCVRSNGHIVR